MCRRFCLDSDEPRVRCSVDVANVVSRDAFDEGPTTDADLALARDGSVGTE